MQDSSILGPDWRKTDIWTSTDSRGRRTSPYNSREFEGSKTRQKSYADNRRRPLEFEEGDYVYLKVSPLRGMRRFKVKGKLSPRFIGPFLILKRVGEVAYQLELPDHLSDVHDVFHVSQLKKCLRVPEEQLPMEDLSVQDDLTYAEYPIKILDTLTRVTRNKVIRCARYNGVIMEKMKLLGREKKSFT
jgi:hypothetical protein